MGSVCCVAARDATLPNRIGGESSQRNDANSPSLNFRWDNRGRVAGEIDSSYQFCRRKVNREMKLTFGSGGSNFSDGVSLLENIGTPTSEKSSLHEAVGLGANPITPPSDLSLSSNNSIEAKNLGDVPEILYSSAPKPSFPMPSSISTPTFEPFYTNTHPAYSTTPSRQARPPPGHQLLRQVSDSRIQGLKSPNNYSVSEGRPSFVLSTCSNDLTPGSQGGSSDGWSMRTFTELVASSQRERWSFDSEQMSSAYGRMSQSSSRFSYSPSVDMKTCGACSKLLTERSAWSSQGIMAGTDLSVVAVLFCGHVYHAECLETMVQEVDRSDPACPICTTGGKEIRKMSIRASRLDTELKAKHHRISRNRVVDSYLDGGLDCKDRHKSAEWETKLPKIEPGSSMNSSFVKPFLKRHFSCGPKCSRSQSMKESSRKKGF